MIDIIFWIIWIPICIILMLSVMVWAVLYTWFQYAKNFILRIFRKNDR